WRLDAFNLRWELLPGSVVDRRRTDPGGRCRFHEPPGSARVGWTGFLDKPASFVAIMKFSPRIGGAPDQIFFPIILFHEKWNVRDPLIQNISGAISGLLGHLVEKEPAQVHRFHRNHWLRRRFIS